MLELPEERTTSKNSGDAKPAWNSLEVAKLIVSMATPLTVVLATYWVQRTLAQQHQAAQAQIAEQDRSLRAREHLAKQRLTIYSQIGEPLNRIFCFVEDVGTWKEDSPDSIIRSKRLIDQVMFSQQALWSPETFDAYKNYMEGAFETYRGVGKDAAVRTNTFEKERLPGWKTGWKDQIVEKDPTHAERYRTMVNLINRDLMLMEGPVPSSAPSR